MKPLFLQTVLWYYYWRPDSVAACWSRST